MTQRSGDAFGREDLNEKISIVSFGFTNCPGVCPVMNKYMSEMYHEFERTADIQFVTISVDPDRDSIEVLRAYADSWGVNDNRWVFLRAPIDSVI